MSNFIGDLFWNYITKPLQERTLDNAYNALVDRRNQGITDASMTAEKTLDNLGVTDPALRAKFTARFQALAPVRKDPTTSFDAFIATAKGEAARLQLQRIAGVNIDDTTPFSKRLFEELGEITKYGITAAGLKVAGSAIPTTNLQYAGIAIDDYLGVSGLSQITGFGYGMLFSSIVSPLVTYELNQKVRASLPLPGEAIRLGYRKFLTDSQVTEILSKQGFSTPYQDALKKGFLFHPQAQDFIRFAVRDTYREDIVAKYQYDAEYPAAIEPDAAEAGFSAKWLKHFWRAHWELPSVTLGYEMLHRGKITKSELETLLRISDIAPWWIPKIIDVSYSPYTRVDVRRLYRDGIITRDQVHRNHLDIGYDEEHAANLTRWVCKEVTSEKKEKNKDLTEAAMTRAYIWGQTDVKTFTAQLLDLDYDTKEAAFVIALADYKNFEDELAAEWRVLKAEYLAELKNDSQISARLTELKLSLREQEKWIRQLKREKRISDVAAYVAAERKKAAAKKEK